MGDERVQRKLAAILAVDVVSFSRMMDEDEAGTLAQLKTLRRELFEPKTAQYGGRTFKNTGDGALVEFQSANDAFQCAVEIQRALVRRNADVPEDRRITLRMGMSLGDVMVDGDDLYGNGVNVAARMESLAEPGEIYISGNVHEHVGDLLDVILEDLGEQKVKNISQPVRTFRVGLGRPQVPSELEASEPPESDKGGLIMRATDRPSIAVLPFENMSGDPEQDYFGDGMAEDIITSLSRFRFCNVIARNSSFTYKGRNVDLRQVGRELSARYVIEGSVRKGGSRLRITAQLIETTSGNHLWAEKYDGTLDEVFDLQDRITEGVVGAIEPSVRLAEIERARRKRPDSLDAYDLYLQALPHAWAYTPTDSEKASELLETALRIDPEYTAAHGLAAFCNGNLATLVPGHPRRAVSVQHARAVLGPDTDDSLALAFATWSLAFFDHDYDVALDAVKRALRLTPSSPPVLAFGALVEAYAGHFDSAVEHAEASLRLSPFDPMRFIAEMASSYGFFFTDRFDDASEAAQRSVNINPQFVPGLILLVASLTRAGRLEAAQGAAARLLSLRPDFRVGEFAQVGRFNRA